MRGNPNECTANRGSAAEAGVAAWRPVQGDGFREVIRSIGIGVAISVPVLALGLGEVYRTHRAHEEARLAAVKMESAYAELAAAAPLPMLDVALATHGRDLFLGACVICHGAEGKGVAGLGRDLTVSNFVAFQDDGQLKEFLIRGRPEARPVGMPPRAGRDDLTDNDLKAIVVYLRGLQDPRRMPELPQVAAAKPSESQVSAALAAAGGDQELAEYIASGDRIYHSSCVACHGKAGSGVQGNGKALASNEFIKSLDDDGLLAFIKQGRSPSDPKNTTGIQMPPKGGNPAMSDDDILDVIAYLRTLQGAKPGAAAGKELSPRGADTDVRGHAAAQPGGPS